MRHRAGRRFCGLVLAMCLLPAATAAASQREIVIWLMPNEADALQPAGMPGRAERLVPPSRLPVDVIRREIETYALQWGEEGPVTLLNVVQPELREQLIALNRHFVEPFWPVVRRQRRVLEELKAFAEAEQVRIRVRIIDWTAAFEEIRHTLETLPAADQPDIVQLGTTWREYYASRGLVQIPTPSQQGDPPLVWTGLRPPSRAETLPFLVDLRLLFCWKRMPRDPLSVPELVLDNSDWEALVGSLREYMQAQSTAERRPPIALPVLANTTNILHSYAPLCYAGGGRFLAEGGKRLDLSSEAALRVPWLIAQNASVRGPDGSRFRLFAFPEASHSEVTTHMMDGHYGGCIDSVVLLHRFQRRFDEIAAEASPDEPRRFEDYVAVTVPPVTFMGGSDLMVTRKPRDPALEDLTFDLGRQLAAGPYARFLAAAGQMPAQLRDEDFGIRDYLERLPLASDYKEAVVETVREAVASGREYAPSKDFPTVIESTETRELLQQVFRRMSEGAGYEQLEASARRVEDAVNVRLDPPTLLRALWDNRLPVTLTLGVLGVGLFIVRKKQAAEAARDAAAREREEAERRQRVEEQARLAAEAARDAEARQREEAEGRQRAEEQARLAAEAARDAEARQREEEEERRRAEEQARLAAEAARDALAERNMALGFTSMPLTIVDEIHKTYHFPFKAGSGANKDKLKKSAWVLNALRELRRGHQDQSWQDEPLADVVWRSILHAVDSVRVPGIFNKWFTECNGQPAIPDFLHAPHENFPYGLLREQRTGGATSPPFHFELHLMDAVAVRIPFLFEQALACVLQNALQASYDGDFDVFATLKLRFKAAPVPRLVVVNRNNGNRPCRQVPARMLGILNANPDIPQFVDHINAVFCEDDSTSWPGMGLVQCYTILRQFYGGIRLRSNKSLTSVALYLTPQCVHSKWEQAP